MRIRNAMILGLLAGLSSSCGSDGLDETASRSVWSALHAAQISQIWGPDTFTNTHDVGVLCADGGSGSANEVHTEAWSHPDAKDAADGQVTGHVAYAMSKCVASPGVSLSGTLRRTFHAVQRVDGPDGSTVLGISDAFFGSLSLDGDVKGACTVDLLREIHQNAATLWDGTLCGHDARALLSSEGL